MSPHIKTTELQIVQCDTGEASNMWSEWKWF